MADNFDLKKFLKESKALENLNPILKKEDLKEGNLREKIKEMIIAELGHDPETDYEGSSEEERYGDYSDDEGGYYPSMQGLEDEPMNDFDPRLMENEPSEEEDFINPGNPEEEAEKRKKYLDDFGMPPHMKSEEEEYEEALIDGGFASLEEAEEEETEETEKETEEETEETEELPGEEGGDEEAPEGGEGGLEDIAADMEGTEGELMDHLMSALKVAKGMDNDKLTTQIGNTLKFFVSEYIGSEE